MKKTTGYFLVFLLLIGCASAKRKIKKSTAMVFASSFYDNQFTGFLVLNAQTKDTVLNFNSEKYFTPASNTKIFTLFTALQLLPDSIPALKYIKHNDTLYIQGTGDPTLLHTYFEQNKTVDFLKKHRNISLHLNNYQGGKFGSGWAWDDYGYYYQPEKGSFPMYGNVATIYNLGGTKVSPPFFKDSVAALNKNINRELEQNQFYFHTSRKDTIEIPFRTSDTLTKALLEKVLQKKITIAQKMPPGEKQTLYSIPSDSVYKRMMHESDNFIAEQLLLLGSSTLSDTLNGVKARDYVLKNQLAHLRQIPRWVDGSGLSRYNLFSPESMVAVLDELYADIQRKRLLAFFPAGGATETLEDWYARTTTPYIYAKSGSLGNNYCLSGYLITKSGKTLIFSFMNNHFRHPSAEVKKQMKGIFELIRDRY